MENQKTRPKKPSRQTSQTPIWIRTGIPIFIISICWAQEIIDQIFFQGNWNFVMGRENPLQNILLSSFSHEDYNHLWVNTTMFIPASWLVLSKGIRDYVSVWLCVLAVELILSLTWTNSSHGLSDICYGLLGYLSLIGILEKRAWEIMLSTIAIILYGGLLPSLLPWNIPDGISWISHFSGFAGGAIGALGIYREQ